ncbi:MAG TPA: alanine racemase [Allosphingosinicella sp.]|nr:alanine racemase [Allosphingosinicella sp.]
MMPAAVIRDEALAHNIREMQTFADRIGAHLCPHGKTTMSPELFAMQLEAGAWGLTAATAHHVRVYRRLGVKRIFLANQLAGAADLEFVLSEVAADPGFDFYCLVDSAAGADRLAAAGEASDCSPRLQVLIETGAAGGRAGVRSAEEAVVLARHIHALPQLVIRGVETFEGISMRGAGRAQAGTILDVSLAAAGEIARARLFAEGAILMSAGGSAFLDLCEAKLPVELEGLPVERVIRPGCYVTHDSGIYERLTRPGGAPLPGLPDLRHALEVWSVVLSVPEPGLAIVAAGKRDLSFDVEPPRPLWRHRPGSVSEPLRAEDLEVVSMWDQHLSLRDPAGALSVGDLVGFGISHPCATFDRWRALFRIDSAYRVSGTVTTLF